MTAPLRELLAEFGFDFDQQALREGTRSIAGVVGAVRSMGQAFVAGALVQGIVNFGQSMIDTGSELDDTSQQLGISATELVEWRHVAKLSGLEANELTSAINRVAIAAGRGSPAFAQLHVRTRDSSGALRRASDIFEDAVVALGDVENTTRRAAIAQRLFGGAGAALVPLFRQGRTGIAQLRAEVRRLYGTDLERLAEQASAAGDAQDRLSLVLDATRTRLSLYLLPAITRGIESMIAWGTTTWEAVRSSSAFEAGLGLLAAGAVVAAAATVGAWGPPLLLFGLLAAGVAAIFLIVEDLVTAFRGGRSVIVEFIDSIAGVGTARQWISDLREAWEGLSLAVRDASNAVSRFLGLGDDTTMAGGEARATSRGFDSAAGVSAQEDALRNMLARARAGEQIDPAERARVTAAYRDWQQGRSVTAGGAPASITSSRSVHVGQIVVHSTDAIDAARRTREEIESAGAADADQALADLVPEGA